MKEREVVIVDGCRTPFGRMGGSLKVFAASDLGGICVKALLDRTGLYKRGGKVDSLMAGMACNDSKCSGVARYIAQLSGLPFEVSATFVEMQGGSAITCLNHAAWKIKMGISDIAIVGGVESHSNTPAAFGTDYEPYKAFAPTPLPRLLTPNPDRNTSLLQSSDKEAAKWGISREACDAYAIRSQQRFQAGYQSGLIGPEIVPVTISATRKTPEQIVIQDENPHHNTAAESFSAAEPLFTSGVTTAVNSSVFSDGAAFLLIMTAEKAAELGYTPYAKWIGCAHSGTRESDMGSAAAYSHLKAAKQLGLKLGSFDVFENNEISAAQQLTAIEVLQNTACEMVDPSKWNPIGGAIAVGCPSAASGARIAISALKQLEKTGGKYGSLSACCGGGQGATTIIENLRR